MPSRSLGLIACSTGAQLEVDRQNKILADLTPSLDACSNRLQEKPDYAGLMKRMSVRNEYSLQMLADPSKPSKDETGRRVVVQCGNCPNRRSPERNQVRRVNANSTARPTLVAYCGHALAAAC